MASPRTTRPAEPAAPAPARPRAGPHGVAWPAAPRWSVRLLGGFELRSERETHLRLPSRAITALLARLALWPDHDHAREALIEHLWPGVDLAVGRNRLRQALSTLKTLLEPLGEPARPVLRADRVAVRVVPGALDCDAREFERLARAGHDDEALALYRGELMPGYYDEWVDEQRLHLAALHDRLQERLPKSHHERAAVPPPAAAQRARTDTAAGRAATPALAPMVVVRQLPQYLTRYFGDDIALTRLAAELREHRLVVLGGPGGIGKTRTAAEVARAVSAQGWPAEGPAAERGAAAPDLVAFVALNACRTPAALTDAVLGALGLAGAAGQAVLEQALAGRSCLLVLDNFEQLPAEADSLLEAWLAALPGLRALVTSRRALATSGARAWDPPALPLPDAGAGLEALAHNPAVALFVDRARGARADFHLGEANAPWVAALVRHLAALPLALELAAARVRSLPPARLVQALMGDGTAARGTPHLDLLARHAPRPGERHATMRQVIDWSWQLLGPEEQALLADLTVFRDSIDLQAVAPVCGLEPLQADHRIDALVAHSLLRRTDGPGAADRLALAEPVREFAAEHLHATRAAALRAAQRAWYQRWAEGWPATPPVAALAAEAGNLAALADASPADGAADAVARLLLALRPGLLEIGVPRPLMAAFDRATRQTGDTVLRARAHAVMARLALQGDGAAAGREHLGLARAALGPSDEAPLELLHFEAVVGWHASGNAEAAQRQARQALQRARAEGRRDSIASMLSLRASVASVAQGRHARAARLYACERAQALRSGNRHAVLTADYNLACTAARAGRFNEALRLCEPLAHAAAAAHNTRLVGEAHNLRGTALAGLRRWPAAVAEFQAYIDLAWRELASLRLAYGLWNLPRPLARCGQTERAAHLAGFAEQFWRSRFAELTADEQRELQRLQRLLRVRAPDADVTGWWRAGATLTPAQAVALALRPATGS